MGSFQLVWAEYGDSISKLKKKKKKEEEGGKEEGKSWWILIGYFSDSSEMSQFKPD